MIKKLKVALVIPDSQNWLGGKNYIINLARTLCNQKNSNIQLIVFCSPKDKTEIQNSLNINNIMILSNNIFKAEGYIMRLFETLILGRQMSFYRLLVKHDIDIYFESTYFAGWRPGIKIITWIPDFQHKAFPGFFSKSAWVLRELQIRLKLICRNSFVFSSNDALNDFKKYYGNLAQNKFHYVAPFAIDKESEGKISSYKALTKYELPDEYFIVCNQMWPHKNHMIVIDAVDILKRKGYEVHVVFTGSLKNGKSLKVYSEINNRIELLKISKNIRILGIIPYSDVLGLIKKSIALINPSKFEGWNTSIEEALLMNKSIIASNLDVHKEQLSDSALYFCPEDPEELTIKWLFF